MRRREFVTGGLAAAITLAQPLRRARGAWLSRVRPGDSGWPDEEQWLALSRSVGGRLAKLVAQGPAKYDRDPFARGDNPALTENSGWLGAWRSEPSAYAVTAQSAQDVAAAVRFAATHNLRLVVKGGGHSYLGGSCAPDSLLIWTRKMDGIVVHDAFQPQGSSAPAVPAISLGAGCIWLHAYRAAQAARRYVQGGGCTTVGVGGLVLGGGYGSFSKRYGLAAASLLEAEIVTADGAVRVVNAAREPDLFWALKGGGGGTFGIVTRFTLATHELPYQFGGLEWTVRARSDAAFQRLIRRFLAHYAQALFNPHWGEQVRLTSGNRLGFAMTFQGLTKAEALAAFQPLADFVAEHPDDYETVSPLSAAAVWALWFWSPWIYRLFARDAVRFDPRPNGAWGDFWWKGDGPQAGIFWDAYQSLWLSAARLEAGGRDALADDLFAASRIWTVELHFNKGLAGAPEEVIAAARETAAHPDVTDAFALAIIAASSPDAPADNSPDMERARERARRVDAAAAALRKACPDAGAYLSECDYFQSDWQRALWGAHYPRLAEIKRRYDPDGLFYVRHGVGSEGWSADGFTRLG